MTESPSTSSTSSPRELGEILFAWLMFLAFTGWTMYLVRNGFTWWALPTGLFALLSAMTISPQGPGEILFAWLILLVLIDQTIHLVKNGPIWWALLTGSFALLSAISITLIDVLEQKKKDYKSDQNETISGTWEERILYMAIANSDFRKMLWQVEDFSNKAIVTGNMEYARMHSQRCDDRAVQR